MREAFFMLLLYRNENPGAHVRRDFSCSLSSLKDAGTKDQREYEEYQEDKEQNLGNGRSTGCDATESEDGGYQCDNEKCDCPA